MKNLRIMPFTFLPTCLVLLVSLACAQSGPVGVQIAPQNSFRTVNNGLQFTATRTVDHWFTSDPTIAIVDATGLVTGVQPGVVTITGVSGPFRNSATLTVIAPPSITSLIFGVPTIAAGQSTTLTGFFSGGTGVITNNQDNSALQVTSSIPVSVSAKSNTVYVLTVTSQDGSSTNKATGLTVAPAPSISSFAPIAGIVTSGNSATLTANFVNGTGRIDINGGGSLGNVNPNTPVITPTLTTTTTFTLTVTGPNGSTATATTTVQVVAAPQFLGAFTGSPGIVSAGTSPSVILNIPIFSPGATGVVTNNVNGNVLNATAAQGSTLFVPNVNTTTTFILTETNQAGTSISAPFTVTAVPLPAVTAFTPSATTATTGTFVLLTPTFSNGAGVITNNVNSNMINVASGSAVSSGLLSANTSFILTVTNAAGAFATTVAPMITVVAAPNVTSFTASPNTIISGNSTQLTGTFTGGTGVISNSVDSSTLSVTSGTPVSVSPTQDIIYTLTVTNAAGTSKSANTYVDVN